MKALATSDIHIHPYMTYSELDEDGVPSRLKAFGILGADTGEVAARHKCDHIWVTGDISHSSVIDPQTAYYIRQYFLNMREKFDGKIVVIPGQHDQSSKALTQSSVHVILTKLLEDIPGLHFYHAPSTLVHKKKKSLTIHLDPWNHNQVSEFEEPGDIYLGHGIVASSKDAHGYNFVNGIDPKELLKNYRISVIGDLHSGQVFWNDDRTRAVLVPGTPIQTSFKDDPNCGFWIVEVPESPTARIQLEFIPIHQVRDDGTYHKFLYVKEDKLEKSYPPHVHVKIVRNESVTRTKKVKDEYVENAPQDAIEVAREYLQSQKLPNLQDALLVLDEIVAKATTADVKSIPQVELLTIDVSNFLSIRNLSLNLEDLAGEVLLVGPNGTGKTSLAEAIFFLFTGALTKSVSVSEVANIYTDEGYEVSGTFRVADDLYKVVRARKGGPSLNLYRVIDGRDVGIDRSSIKETQQYLESLIGVSSWWINLLCYFSTNNLITFSGMGGADQNDLLSTLVGGEVLESLRSAAKPLVAEATSTAQKAAYAAEITTKTISDRESEVAQLKQQAVPQAVDHTPLYEEILGLVGEMPEDLSSARRLVTQKIEVLQGSYDDQVIKEADRVTRELRDVIQDISSSESKAQEYEDQISRKKKDYVTAMDRKCFTCGQKLQDDAVEKRIQSELTSLADSLTKAIEGQDKHKSKKAELESQVNSAKLKAQAMVVIKSKLDALILIERKISRLIVDSVQDDSEVKIVTLQSVIQKESARLESLLEESKTAAARSSTLQLVAKLFDRNGPVVTILTKRVCMSLENEMNNLINNEKAFSCRITPGKSVDLQVSYNGGKYVSVSALSGGERRLADILSTIGLINLFSRKYFQKHGLLSVTVFDEMFSFLDPAYGELAYQALIQCTSKLKLVITHDVALQSHFHQVIKVKKVNNCSEYQL